MNYSSPIFRHRIRLLRSELGATMVELGLLIVLIAVIAIPALKDVGWKSACRTNYAAALISLSAQPSPPYVHIFGRCSFPLSTWSPKELMLARLMDDYNRYCARSASDPVIENLIKSCL